MLPLVALEEAMNLPALAEQSKVSVLEEAFSFVSRSVLMSFLHSTKPVSSQLMVMPMDTHTDW